MAEFSTEQLAQTLESKGGYNPTDARNASTGPRASELAREFGLTTGTTGTTRSTGTSIGGVDYSSILKQQQEAQQQAIQPAIQSLQAGIPETQQAYATERQRVESKIDPLKERYDNLIASITRKGTEGEQAQTRVTAGEMGKRGIPLTSTLAQQQIQSAVQPIRGATQEQLTETGIAREEGIQSLEDLVSGLTTQETQATRDIQNAIAQLQAGGSQTAVQNALSLLSSGIQQQQFEQSLAEQQRQDDIANRLSQQQFEQITLPTTQANLANIQSQIAQRGKEDTNPYQQMAEVLGIDRVQQIFGGTPQATQQGSLGIYGKDYNFGLNNTNEWEFVQ